jgi:hypothetical protein
MINPFLFSNNGYNLSIMLYYVDYIIKNKIMHIIIILFFIIKCIILN